RRLAREGAASRGAGVAARRDVGPVVCPGAQRKVDLPARPAVRAERRAAEVTGPDYETVAADLARRDALDQGRETAPLRVPEGAVELDTSDMTVEEIVDEIVRRLGDG